ncbi:MAG: cofactor-independent phosphoglycerate mutase [Oscillospiraceae bacterium]|nr:cofactor-independent phosphoglycerate mutase [Oscillospiraceae bacterium]
MKYVVLIIDGAADYKIESLGFKTPLDVANKPVMDFLASKSLAGTVSNVPAGMVPESDPANLAVLSYDPAVYCNGRSPLEAVSMGIDMQPDETAFRCNIVTLDGETMIDHSSDEITTPEADKIIKTLDEHFGDENKKFYTGVSYRHCLIWKNAPEFKNFMRPHDILGKLITEHLPPEPFLSMMRESYDVLKNHPVNVARIERGLRPANSMWLWSPGKKPALPSFKEKWGLNGAVISAVDLMKGIGICAGMKAIYVEGATGNIHTNYKGKADAAINALQSGTDFVYIHVEAPDECGHRNELENKILSIEYIDERILKHIYKYLESSGEDYKIMVLPDHPTPMCIRTHSSDPVPFIIYSNTETNSGVEVYNEDNCTATGLYIEHGYNLLGYMIC